MILVIVVLPDPSVHIRRFISAEVPIPLPICYLCDDSDDSDGSDDDRPHTPDLATLRPYNAVNSLPP